MAQDTSALWVAAARSACRNGDHDAEMTYRDTARLIRRRPALRRPARCIEKAA